MNCDEYQRTKMSDPDFEDADVKAHEQSCRICQEFTAELVVLDTSLIDAMQVPVPASLHDHLEDTPLVKRKQGMMTIGYAAMASLLTLFAIYFFTTVQSPPPLSNVLLTHIEKEPFALTTVMDYQPADVKATFASVGVDANQPIEDVRFIKRCFIKGELVAHMVIEGEKGPVTVFVMPNVKARNVMDFKGEQLQGKLVPISTKHSMAVIGYLGEPLQAILERYRDKFTFI